MKITNKRLVSILLCLAMVLAVLPVAAFAAGTTTLYCDAPDSWEICNVYWWGSASSVSWPGEAMTKGSDGLWYYEVPSDATNVIFNNKVGEDGVQSADLVMPTDDNVQYNYEAKSWGAYGSAAEPVETVYYLRGTMNGWGATDAFTKQEDGTYTITMDLAAGSYEYKAGVEDWSWSCPAGGNATMTLEADDSVTFILDLAANTLVYTLGSGTVVEYDYYVAGSAGLCGVEWDPTQNLMAVDGDGLYTITFANIAAGDYEFKVTTGDWSTPSYGDNGENYAITVEALSNVTITFNAETSEIGVDIAVIPKSTAPEAMALGDNAFEIVEGDINALSSTYTVEEDGILVVNVSSMSSFDAYSQEWSEVPPMHIGMQFGRMYALTVNGEQVWLPGEIEVSVGDKVEIAVKSFMGTATKLAINLSMREPGSKDVKWQLKGDATPNDETVDLRLISYVYSMDYSAVEFNVTIGGVTQNLACTKVYESINANGQPIAAGDLFDGAAYLVTYIIEGVPASVFNSEIEVTVTWTDLDGYETTSTETRTIVIADNWA